MIWNCLDYTALAFPVTRVDSALDERKPPHQFLSEKDRTVYESCRSDLRQIRLFVDESASIDDSPEAFANAPVSLQLVGHTMEEEAVIKMTEVISAALSADI